MTALTSSAPPLRNKYATFLIRYLPGTGRDLPIVSPRARGLQGRSRAAPFTGAELAEAYSTDPFLAAKLCGVANSIFFNLDHAQLTSISEALDRVGSEYAQKLLASADLPGPAVAESDVLEYWAHCVTVAALAPRIALLQKSPLGAEETLHLLGLIHDIGFLVEVSYNPQFMPEVAEAIRGAEPDGPNSHAALGASLSAFWSLPPLLQDALRGHHDLRHCKTPEGQKLAALLRLADNAATGGSFDELQVRRAIALLGISKEQLTSLVPHARQVHGALLSAGQGG
jgi:HD-like signal output (HDOD) protein